MIAKIVITITTFLLCLDLTFITIKIFKSIGDGFLAKLTLILFDIVFVSCLLVINYQVLHK